MEITVAKSLVINAPEFYADWAFVAWLDRDVPKFMWHRPGDTPSEWTDVVVLVDPSLNGEGSDQDMPRDIWDRIVGACRQKFLPGGGNHIAVRITNLS